VRFRAGDQAHPVFQSIAEVRLLGNQVEHIAMCAGALAAGGLK